VPIVSQSFTVKQRFPTRKAPIPRSRRSAILRAAPRSRLEDHKLPIAIRLAVCVQIATTWMIFRVACWPPRLCRWQVSIFCRRPDHVALCGLERRTSSGIPGAREAGHSIPIYHLSVADTGSFKSVRAFFVEHSQSPTIQQADFSSTLVLKISTRKF
jgi:hypothetical protein